jgi:hypothetical protein
MPEYGRESLTDNKKQRSSRVTSKGKLCVRK